MSAEPPVPPQPLSAPPPGPKGSTTNWVRYGAVLALGLVLGLVIGVAVAPDNTTEAAASTSSQAVVETPSPTAEPSLADPVASPSEEGFEFNELEFGDTLPVTNDDATEDVQVTLLTPTLAKCQYGSIGCTPPETGERVVQIEVTIKNSGSAVSPWGSDFFVLEFRDGTQMLTSDGNAYEYAPDNAMDYTVKVRPGSTYRSVLVFEAPNGPFSVLILTSEFEGEPFASWS